MRAAVPRALRVHGCRDDPVAIITPGFFVLEATATHLVDKPLIVGKVMKIIGGSRRIVCGAV
jgi:hypothetical protein